MKIIARNKTASFNYFLEEKYEAGIKLVGSEIKSIREGKVSINEAYVVIRNNEAFILNMHIAQFAKANRFNHDETRTRKLLLHKRQIVNLAVKGRETGYSIIPVKLYLKDDVERYNQERIEHLKKFGRR